MRRIGGWQRIGIILSVAWAAVGPFYLNHRAFENAVAEAGMTYHVCRDGQRAGDDPMICRARSDEVLHWEIRRAIAAPVGSLGWLIIALVPVGLGWLFVYLIVWLFRWVKAGFKST
jgi:hypothetical protein